MKNNPNNTSSGLNLNPTTYVPASLYTTTLNVANNHIAFGVDAAKNIAPVIIPNPHVIENSPLSELNSSHQFYKGNKEGNKAYIITASLGVKF